MNSIATSPLQQRAVRAGTPSRVFFFLCRSRLAFAWLSVLFACGGQAAAADFYTPSRVLHQNDNACLDIKRCKTVATAQQTLGAGTSDVLVPTCPTNHPYLVGWDAAHNEHVGASVVAGSITANGLRLVIWNHGNTKGAIKV
ncbi:MAG: hypothetical protein ABI612_11230 [Betaproteobacteria bacterium]